MVESDDGAADGPQRSYLITDPGRDELSELLGPPPENAVPPRDELVIKVLIAMRLPDVDVVELVQAHRRRPVGMRQYFTHLKEDAHDDEVGFLIVADAEIYRLDAVIRWLDSAEARLRHLPESLATGPRVALRDAGVGFRSPGERDAGAAAGLEVLSRGSHAYPRARGRRSDGPRR